MNEEDIDDFLYEQDRDDKDIEKMEEQDRDSLNSRRNTSNLNDFEKIDIYTTEELKKPYKVICGVCAGYIEESDNPEGELGYDGCEEMTGEELYG